MYLAACSLQLITQIAQMATYLYRPMKAATENAGTKNTLARGPAVKQAKPVTVCLSCAARSRVDMYLSHLPPPPTKRKEIERVKKKRGVQR
jgi:hypothetical protein